MRDDIYRSDELITNGINGATGDYGLRLTAAQLAQFGREQLRREQESARRPALRSGSALRSGRPVALPPAGKTFRGVKEGVDTGKLEEAGWGVVFAREDERAPAIREALSELLRWRASQAGELYRELGDGHGYRQGESKQIFLDRRRVSPTGPVDPRAGLPGHGLPFYILLVGDPEHIPFDFQYQLDIQYAVGRIHFDTLAEYESYARSVVAAEKGEVRRQRQVTFFGPENPNDPLTSQTNRYLLDPLQGALENPPEPSLQFDLRSWDFERLHGAGASRRTLDGLLRGESRPALLFTASHGLEFPKSDRRQLPHQGALMCQDWPGPDNWRKKEIPEDFYLAGDHLDGPADVHGLITLHFACFGSGTPRENDFHIPGFPQGGSEPIHADRPFVARLPQRLLGHPRGGALAVVGHVDRALGYSFRGRHRRAPSHTATFQTAVARLLKGATVGRALEVFGQRHSEHSAGMVRDSAIRSPDGARDFAERWAAHHDARNYIVLGDPAVRLAVDGSSPDRADGEKEERSAVSQMPYRLNLESSGPDDPSPGKIGKPPALSQADWDATPPAVQRVTARALGLIEKLENEIAAWRREKP